MEKELLVLVPFKEHHMEQIRAAADNQLTVHQFPQGLSGTEAAEALAIATAVVGEP